MSIFWFERSALDVPEADEWLSEKERSYLGGLRFPKRRDEWRLGRWTAKCSIASSLGLPSDIPTLSQIEIWPDRSGAPEVFLAHEPAHLAISLSHRAGKAVCAVAPFEARIGCDLELIESRHPAFLSDYFATDEQALVAHTAPDLRDFTVTLLWSGKESALKALHLGLRLDTRSLNVCLTESPPPSRDSWLDSYPLRLLNSHSTEQESSDLWHPFQVLLKNVPTFVGWWRNPDELVRTVVIANPSCPAL
jgi:4'-phosphopantetheinyl transferase